MKFEIDEQTIADLEIFSTPSRSKSVFSLFNFTQYKGGQDKLYSFLSNPLTDIEGIVFRRDAIAFFQSILPLDLQIDKDALGFAEYYLKHAHSTAELPTRSIYFSKFWDNINPSKEFFIIEKGAKSAILFLQSFYGYSKILSEKLNRTNPPQLLAEKIRKVMTIFALPEFQSLLKIEQIKVFDAFKFDYFFRKTRKNELKFLIDLVYEYDAYISVAKAAEKYHFCYPDFTTSEEKCLHAEELFHPFVEKAVSSSIQLGDSENLLFITGPNMAGKSTFLKALGIAAYLAHVGFPVPAQKMKLSQLSGVCSSINVSDNLSAGYSHFYAEVIRVKEVVSKLKKNNKMLVIFDELFRGTNVKDAFDGTLAVVSAFSKIKTAFFVVSSHIVEVVEELKKIERIRFGYFEVLQKDAMPKYTYKLKDGVSDIRLGMYIINREKLIDDIESIS